MTASASDLRLMPVFRTLSEDQIKVLFDLLSSRFVEKGEVLFNAGEISREFQLLVEGELELAEPGEPAVLLHPFAPVGELGALTGLPRNATARVTSRARILFASVDKLLALFASHPAIGFAFTKALLDVVGEKVRRDKLRMTEMRSNLIRTQKAMKEIRDLILSAEENPLSEPLCARLDDLIEHNRRSHYRVAPTESHPAFAKIFCADVAVTELSEGYVKLAPELAAPATKVGDELTFVLALPTGEIPMSGRVERIGGDGVLIRLDMLIDLYQAAIGRYMTELQMLDFVV